MNFLTQTHIEQVIALVEKAADTIMTFYESGIAVQRKSDDSPVTKADLAASQLLESELPKIAPYPVLSEENVPSSHDWMDWQTYWLIDPIDGTKHFINQTGEFCICVALIHCHQPIFGFIYAPTIQTGWFAQQQSAPSSVFRYHQQTIEPLVETPPEQLSVALSANRLSDNMHRLLSVLPDFSWYQRGSALKYIDVVEGKAHLYPKMWDTCEWDSAAGQCLVECAGGSAINLITGEALTYGKRQSLINPHFIVHRGLSDEYIEALMQQYKSMQAHS